MFLAYYFVYNATNSMFFLQYTQDYEHYDLLEEFGLSSDVISLIRIFESDLLFHQHMKSFCLTVRFVQSNHLPLSEHLHLQLSLATQEA